VAKEAIFFAKGYKAGGFCSGQHFFAGRNKNQSQNSPLINANEKTTMIWNY
jgi:hypothetical protein